MCDSIVVIFMFPVAMTAHPVIACAHFLLQLKFGWGGEWGWGSVRSFIKDITLLVS